MIRLTHAECELYDLLAQPMETDALAVTVRRTAYTTRKRLIGMERRGAVLGTVHPDKTITWERTWKPILRPTSAPPARPDDIVRRVGGEMAGASERRLPDTTRLPSDKPQHYGTDGFGRLVLLDDRSRAPWSPWGKEQVVDKAPSAARCTRLARFR